MQLKEICQLYLADIVEIDGNNALILKQMKTGSWTAGIRGRIHRAVPSAAHISRGVDAKNTILPGRRGAADLYAYIGIVRIALLPTTRRPRPESAKRREAGMVVIDWDMGKEEREVLTVVFYHFDFFFGRSRGAMRPMKIPSTITPAPVRNH